MMSRCDHPLQMKMLTLSKAGKSWLLRPGCTPQSGFPLPNPFQYLAATLGEPGRGNLPASVSSLPLYLSPSFFFSIPHPPNQHFPPFFTLQQGTPRGAGLYRCVTGKQGAEGQSLSRLAGKGALRGGLRRLEGGGPPQPQPADSPPRLSRSARLESVRTLPSGRMSALRQPARRPAGSRQSGAAAAPRVWPQPRAPQPRAAAGAGPGLRRWAGRGAAPGCRRGEGSRAEQSCRGERSGSSTPVLRSPQLTKR